MNMSLLPGLSTAGEDLTRIRVVISGNFKWKTRLLEGGLWKTVASRLGAAKIEVISDQDIDISSQYDRSITTIFIPLLQKDHIFLNEKFSNKSDSTPDLHFSLIPSSNTIRLFANRIKFREFSSKHHLDVFLPKQYQISDLSEISLPVMLKRVGEDFSWGKGVSLIFSKSDLLRLVNRFCNAGHEFTLEEAVSGDKEYATHCLADKGSTIVWHKSYYRKWEKNYFIAKGSTSTEKNSIRVPHEPSAQHLEVFQKFLKAANYVGPCVFDYKILNDKREGKVGKLKIFEINPRFGGSLMRAENRVDLAECLEMLVKYGLANST